MQTCVGSPSQAVTKISTGSWNKTRAAHVWLCEFTLGTRVPPHDSNLWERRPTGIGATRCSSAITPTARSVVALTGA